MAIGDKNYWAVILGASSGMGLATAKKLAAEGFNLCLVYRDRKSAAAEAEEQFDQLRKAGAKVRSFNIDALNHDKRGDVISEMMEIGGEGSVRLLLHSIARGNLKLMAPYMRVIPDDPVYNAAAGYLKNTFGNESAFLKEDDFSLTLHAMAVSFYTWTRALFEAGLFASEATVLSLTSEGSAKAWRNYAAVGAAKAALESISRAMALEFAPHGIRSNVLQPGVTITPSFRMIKGNELIEQQSLLRNPFGRLTTPGDVANVVYLLSRPEAAWINGAVIPVDGGESIA